MLNEKTFRNYVGRALILETSQEGADFQGETTLTVFTTRKPEQLLERYPVQKITDWKYRVDCFKDLDVYLLIQKEMRGKKEGEALALLQVLEGEREKQMGCWKEILSQDLENTNILKQIIEKLNREVYMNFVKEIEEKAKKKRDKEIARKMVEKGISREMILEVTELTAEELQEIQKEMKDQKGE